MMSAWSSALFVYGLSAVISMVIAAMIWGMGLVFDHLGKRQSSSASAKPAMPKPAASAAAGAAPAVSSAASANSISDEIAAVISAAVAASLGPQHRIVHIGHAGEDHSWVGEGRLMHHGSHQVHHH